MMLMLIADLLIFKVCAALSIGRKVIGSNYAALVAGRMSG